MHSLFVNFPDVICFTSKLCIFDGEDTNLVKCGPRSILLPLFTIYCKLCFFCLLQTTIFHTIRLILCVQQDRWDLQPHCTVGAKYFDCVVQVPRCSDKGSAPYQCQLHQPRDDLISPTGSITLVSYWGKTYLLWSTHLTLGVSQQVRWWQSLVESFVKNFNAT